MAKWIKPWTLFDFSQTLICVLSLLFWVCSNLLVAGSIAANIVQLLMYFLCNAIIS